MKCAGVRVGGAPTHPCIGCGLAAFSAAKGQAVLMALTDFTSARGRRRLAWAVPVVVAGGIAAAIALTTAASSGAGATLTPRSAQQLLVAVQRHADTPLSGEVHESLNLGLPSLPGDRSSASLSWQSFLTGSHTVRVWVDGKNKQRVALLGQLSEADVVHNGNQVWTYTSDTDAVSHSIMRGGGGMHADAAHRAKPNAGPDASKYTPAGVAAQLLKAVRPSTKVTVESSPDVAGRPVYALVLSPKDARSTVGSVRIAVDAAKFVPLQVEVLARDNSTVFKTGFSQVSYSKPAASVFNFHKPRGSSGSGNPFTWNGDRHHGDGRGRFGIRPSTADKSGRPVAIGTGWTTVVELSGGSAAQLSGGLLDQLTNPVGSSGLRLLHSSLVNALFTADGRAFVGAVSPAYLERVAAAHPH